MQQLPRTHTTVSISVPKNYLQSQHKISETPKREKGKLHSSETTDSDVTHVHQQCPRLKGSLTIGRTLLAPIQNESASPASLRVCQPSIQHTDLLAMITTDLLAPTLPKSANPRLSTSPLTSAKFLRVFQHYHGTSVHNPILVNLNFTRNKGSYRYT